MTLKAQSDCTHPSWYEEGQGEGAVRCCRTCGFIAMQIDPLKQRPTVDLSPDAARQLRARAGLSAQVVEQIEHGDLNQKLGVLLQERRFFVTGGLVSAAGLVLFRSWVFEAIETTQHAIFGGLFLFAVYAYVAYRVYATTTEIRRVRAKVAGLDRTTDQQR